MNTNSAPDFGNKVQSCGTEDANNDCFLGRGSGGGPADEDHMDRYGSRNVSVGQGTMTGCRPGGEGCCNYIRCFSYSFATINFIALRPVWR